LNRPGERVRFTLTDLILIFILLLFLGYVFYRISYTLEYKWNWSVIGQYIIRFDESGNAVAGILLKGLFTTLKLSLWAGILASFLGLIMGLARISENFFLNRFSSTYVNFVRNIPSIVFIFIFYYFFSSQVLAYFDIENSISSLSDSGKYLMELLFCRAGHFPVFISAVLTLAIYEGAYMTEIVRAGIESVEKGQWEAADSLGFSKYQRMRLIIFPQAFRRIIPSVAGQLISVIKDSAIVSVISVQDLTFQGMELMASTYRTFEIWITITIMYFIITFSCSRILRSVNLRMQKRGYQ